MNNEISQSLSFYNSLFEENREPIIICDQELGLIVDGNRSVCNFLHTTKENLIGLHQNNLSPTEEPHKLHDSLMNHIKEKSDKSFIAKIVTADNTIKGVEIKFNTFTLNNKVFIQEIFTNITEKLKLQTFLTLQNDVLELIAINKPLEEILNKITSLGSYCFENSGCSISIFNPDANTLIIKAASAIPDYFIQAIDNSHLNSNSKTGHSKKFAFSTINDPNWDKLKEDLIRTNFQSCWSYPILADDSVLLGTLTFFLPSPESEPTEKELSAIVKIIHITKIAIINNANTDSTKIQNIENSLSKLEQIFEHAPVGMIVTSPAGEFIKINQTFCKMTGYTEFELNLKTLHDLTHPEDLEELAKSFLKSKNLSNDIITFEKRCIKKNGGILWVNISISSIFNQSGELDYYITQMEDITIRKNSEEEKKVFEEKLRLSQKMETVGRMAGGIAHNFNNLLTPITLMSDMIKRKYNQDEPLYNYACSIHHAAGRAQEIVKEIMMFSKSEDKEEENIKLSAIINEAVNLLRPVIKSSLIVTISSESIIRGIPSQLHQLLVNLIINADQANERSNGNISINLTEQEINPTALLPKTLQSGLYQILTIQDDGKGINLEIINNIFDPFFSTHINGAPGLGLSVVHGIIKRMKGEIMVDSMPNKGSQFRIFLPVTTIIQKEIK